MRSGTEHNNVSKHPAGRFSNISAGERDVELSRQFQETIEEAIHPGIRQAVGKRQRQECCPRLPSHSGDVTQSAGQAAVANSFGRMPLPTKMYTFQREIGRDERFMSLRQAQHGAIVADPFTNPRALAQSGTAADIRDQDSFWQRQGKTNI
jgi:hypothetical protein